MSKPIKKIILFLSLFILIPILFLVERGLFTFGEEERMLNDIYEGQLESILFSVNQYSEDLVRSWMIKVESELEIAKNDYTLFSKRINYLFKESRSIKGMFFLDVSTEELVAIDTLLHRESRAVAESFVFQNQKIIDRLIEYKKANYTKIRPIELTLTNTTGQYLIYILRDNLIVGFEINPKLFIEQNLAGKIQSVSRQEFAVTVFDSSNAQIIYSSFNTNDAEVRLSRQLWLIPKYSIGIAPRGRTIESLVDEKIQNNLIMISLLAVFMMAAAFWGYRNIKKEIELAQIKSDFVSNVSHELRTPLALITMFAETLSLDRVKTEEKKQEYYNIIQQETERLSKIVNKILNFSKIEAGKWKYNFVIKDLTEIVAKVYETYKFHLTNSGFEFEIETTKDLLIGNYDEETISEAVINLIDNAVKYCGDRKYVKLKTGKNTNGFFLEVIDHGIGISLEEQKKIFDKFYRVTSGEIHNTKGTGLGLTLVQHIVEAHKGSISLKSEPGNGSTFTLTFPPKKD